MFARKAALVFFMVFLPSREASAALLELPTTSARDGGMYATAAIPRDPLTCLATSPAGLTELGGTVVSGGLQAPLANFRYRSPQGYDHLSSAVPLAPNFGISTDRFAPWFFGIGAYGNLGFATDFAADPANGMPSPISNELAVVKFAPTVAYRVTPWLGLGASVLPSYGRQKARAPVPVAAFGVTEGEGVVPIKVYADGPGVAGQVGVLLGPWHRFSLAVTYRTRGKLWLSGKARGGERKDKVDVTYELPQALIAGLAYENQTGLAVALQVRWTDWTSLNHSDFDFSAFDALDRPISRHTRSVVGLGGGVEYVTEGGIALRACLFHEPRAVAATDLWPALVDASFTGFGAGFGYRAGAYQIDFFTGASVLGEKKSVVSEAGFPGSYKAEGGYVFGVEISRFWGKR